MVAVATAAIDNAHAVLPGDGLALHARPHGRTEEGTGIVRLPLLDR
jgi:hypothetical protein